MSDTPKTSLTTQAALNAALPLGEVRRLADLSLDEVSVRRSAQGRTALVNGARLAARTPGVILQVTALLATPGVAAR